MIEIQRFRASDHRKTAPTFGSDARGAIGRAMEESQSPETPRFHAKPAFTSAVNLEQFGACHELLIVFLGLCEDLREQPVRVRKFGGVQSDDRHIARYGDK